MIFFKFRIQTGLTSFMQSTLTKEQNCGASDPNASVFLKLSPDDDDMNKSVFASLKAPQDLANQTIAGINPATASASKSPINRQ